MDEYSQLHRRYCFLLYSYLLLVVVVVPKLVSGCHEEGRQALLNFKHGGLLDPANRLSSWGSVTKDCCSWDGVGCNNTTRHIVKLTLRNANLDVIGWPLSNYSLGGKIDSSLIHLQHLTYLDLSGNNFNSMTAIPEVFGSFEHLEYLNLSWTKFVRKIPHQLGNISKLHTIDDFAWVSSLSSLLYLDLSYVDLSTAENWVQQINQLSVLRELHLAGCMLPKIHSPILQPFPNLTATLNVLDLSSNYQLIPEPQSWLTNFSSLTHLYLRAIGFHGSMPSSIGNLTNLEVLDLSDNSIYGTIPASFSTNLCKLRILNLEGNSHISGIWGRSMGSICLANSLQELYLGYNFISGTVPRSLIGNLCHLRILSLEGNSIRGMEPLPRCHTDSLEELNLSENQLGGDLQVLHGEISNSKTLKILDLSGNKLSGHVILQNIGKLSNLVSLSISSNSLPLVITEDVLSNLQRLENIDLSNNRLVWKTKSRTWLPPNIKTIDLSSSQVGPKFPSWLQYHASISNLYMFNASISDDVPHWFWKIAVNMKYLHLDDNQLRGYLPKNIGMSTWSDLYLSNNSFSGPIPEDLCMLENIEFLDLSSNHFHGNIPDCWGKGGRNLWYIDLSNNNLSGDFPHSLGDLSSLAFLHMRNNSISGKISTTTKVLKNLVVLDLSYNRLFGVLPPWGTVDEHLSNLRILSLRSNMIHGNLPSQISQLSSLQFLDISCNMLSGIIPVSFGKFAAMSRIHNESDEWFDQVFSGGITYSTYDYVWMNLKGVELENRGTLGLMNVIDLSSNNLSGDIPEELTHLLGLVSLNFSGNNLKGKIPENIGELKQLESFDLSRNKLSGEIPLSISNLNFLSKLNLSYNNLSGKIPSGSQLQTLNDPSVYVGNENLCGPPLLRKCLINEPPNMGKGGAEKKGKEDEIEIIGLFISIALGFVVGFWGFCGLLIFKRSWRIWYYRYLDEMMDKIFVALAVRAARLKRKFNMPADI